MERQNSHPCPFGLLTKLSQTTLLRNPLECSRRHPEGRGRREAFVNTFYLPKCRILLPIMIGTSG